MSWGATWVSRWAGGAAMVVPVPAVRPALRIISRFQDLLEAVRFEDAFTGAELRLWRSDGRDPLELAPAGGGHRTFEVRLTAGRIARQYFGAGKAFLGATATVRVSYARPGGDAGGGDRTSVNIQAGEDSMLIADALTDFRNWDRETTGIRMVTLDQGALRVADDRLREIWETRLEVEHEVPWPLSVAV